MRLVALREISDTVGVIRAGQVFVQQDEERAETLIKSGLAEPDSGRWRGLRWDGATVVIMASGPSLTQRQAERVRVWRASEGAGRVIAINTTYLMALWADLLYACDARWYRANIADVRATFRGQLWTQDPDARREFGVNLVASQNGRGLSKAPGVINQGQNSGFQAINLAWQAGAAKIVLLGFDVKAKDGRKHWHSDHPGALNAPLPFAAWIRGFEALAADLSSLGFDIVNATPGSALDCFKRSSLESALS